MPETVNDLPETHPIVFASKETRERNDYKHPESDDRCLICNGPIKDYTKAYSVHMTVDGHAYRADLARDAASDSQGWFSVGPECRKKLPAAYTSAPTV